MARKRMIDPSIWTNEKIGECSFLERLLYIGLISQADDSGRGKANTKWLKAVLFPYDDTEPGEITAGLMNLSRQGLILLYSADGCQYYALPTWHRWQVINKPTPSKIPAPICSTPAPLPEDYGKPTVALPPNRIERNKIERNREEENTHARETFGTFKNVLLSPEDQKLLEKHIPRKTDRDFYIEQLSCYLSQSGKSYASHAAVMIKWYQKDHAAPANSYSGKHDYNPEDFAADYTDIFDPSAMP